MRKRRRRWWEEEEEDEEEKEDIPALSSGGFRASLLPLISLMAVTSFIDCSIIIFFCLLFLIRSVSVRNLP